MVIFSLCLIAQHFDARRSGVEKRFQLVFEACEVLQVATHTNQNRTIHRAMTPLYLSICFLDIEGCRGGMPAHRKGHCVQRDNVDGVRLSTSRSAAGTGQ